MNRQRWSGGRHCFQENSIIKLPVPLPMKKKKKKKKINELLIIYIPVGQSFDQYRTTVLNGDASGLFDCVVDSLF
jgi:hypothetical protein